MNEFFYSAFPAWRSSTKSKINIRNCETDWKFLDIKTITVTVNLKWLGIAPPNNAMSIELHHCLTVSQWIEKRCYFEMVSVSNAYPWRVGKKSFPRFRSIQASLEKGDAHGDLFCHRLAFLVTSIFNGGCYFAFLIQSKINVRYFINELRCLTID